MKYILTILLTIIILPARAQLRIDSLAVNRIKARNATQITITDSLKIQKGTAIIYIQPRSDSSYIKSNKPISVQGIPTKKALKDTANNLRVEIATKYAGLPDQTGHVGQFLQSNGLSESWQESATGGSDTAKFIEVMNYDGDPVFEFYKGIYSKKFFGSGGTYGNDLIIRYYSDSTTIGGGNINVRNTSILTTINGGISTNGNISTTGTGKFISNDSIRSNKAINTPKINVSSGGIIKIGNDTVPVRKPMAADTTGLSGRIGDIFIDNNKNTWENYKNGRGGWSPINGVIKTFISTVSTSGTGEIDLYSYTLPANILTKNGDNLIFDVYLTNSGDNATSSYIKCYFGVNDSVVPVQGVTFYNGGFIHIQFEIYRTSSTTAYLTQSSANEYSVSSIAGSFLASTGLDFSTTNIIKITGKCLTNGFAAKFGKIELKKTP